MTDPVTTPSVRKDLPDLTPTRQDAPVSLKADADLLEAELRARVERAWGPWDEAVWRLQLGEPDEGLAIIRGALPGLREQGNPTVPLAYFALVAGEAELAAQIASAAIAGALPQYVPGSREYRGVTLGLIADDDGKARAFQADLERFVGTHEKLRGGEPSGVSDITGGLLERDADRVTRGVEVLLAWHLRRARARSDVFNSSLGVVSLDAVVALLLAHRIGLSVPVDAKYHAAQVPLLVIHLTEWHGRPLERARPLSFITNLVAGPWLRSHGIDIADPPAVVPRPPAEKGAAGPRRPVATGADAEEARQALERRLQLGGGPWQKASWSRMLGDMAGAREHLRNAASEARARWQESMPRPGGPMGWLRKDQALPNHNFVRDHFALALVLSDEAGLRESGSHLRAWLRTQEGRGWPIYGHAVGYLDLICDLIGADRTRPSPAEIDRVQGPGSTRVAAIGLARRDPSLVREGLEGILADHARTLERKTSPPPPISETAVQFAVAARRLGVPLTVDERYATWPVPVEGDRLPCDLLGRAVWSGQA